MQAAIPAVNNDFLNGWLGYDNNNWFGSNKIRIINQILIKVLHSVFSFRERPQRPYAG